MADNSSIFNSKSKSAFALKLSVFLIFIGIIDFSVGSLLAKLYFNAREGDFGGRINLALHQSNDIVIFGSSRAQDRYIPDMLEQQVNHSVFNAGLNGQSIIFHYCLQKLIFQKYLPKWIILELNYSELLNNHGNDNHNSDYERLSILLPFAYNDQVRSVLQEGDPFLRVKFLSKIYPFNSHLLSILKFAFKPNAQGAIGNKGYTPLNGSKIDKIISITKSQKHINPPEIELDTLKLAYLKKFIDNAYRHNVKVIICRSPTFELNTADQTFHDRVYATYKELFRKLNVPFIEITNEQYSIFDNPKLFYDIKHLNREGAEAFSKIFAAELKPFLSKFSQKNPLTAHN